MKISKQKEPTHKGVREDEEKKGKKHEDRNEEVRKIKAFLAALDDSVSIFHAVNEISNSSSKLKEVRARLKKIQNTAMVLHANLEDVSFGERDFLGEEISTLIDTLNAVSVRVAQLLIFPRKVASKLKPGRRPVDYSTLQMAAHVAEAMRHDLGEIPTSTKNGLFIELLEIVYQAATGKDPKALHGLAGRALKVKVKRNPDGSIIFDPSSPI